ncbi:MAG: metallophosphoesterase family protein [Flavobacteriaceae bacterium]|nr:metallophosphoesterase family protein [Flavobacteriaceae bacterium]
MKILLLSDTHSYMDEAILKHANSVDQVWHAGDIGNFEVYDALSKKTELKAVYGNIDDAKMRSQLPEHICFEVSGLKVLMLHIGGSPGRYAKGVTELIKNYQPKVFVCGHSHILKVQYDANFDCLYMNPGAIGKHGFHHKRTMLKFDIKERKPSNLVLIEYPR